MTGITFNPDGMARCLYTEMIDLAVLGELTVRRASNIEFDNASQVWRVLDIEGKPLYENKSRLACIEWEHNAYANGITTDNHTPDRRII